MTAAAPVAKGSRIRVGQPADRPRLVAMGCQFVQDTGYRDRLPLNPEALAALADRLLSGGDDVTLLVADVDDAPVGMLGLMAYTHPMSGERVTSEAVWWVDPAVRGGTLGVRLLRAGEQWARDRGAVALQMIQPVEADRVGALYAALGYAPVETTWMRRL